jgi:hypothetical protein
MDFESTASAIPPPGPTWIVTPVAPRYQSLTPSSPRSANRPWRGSGHDQQCSKRVSAQSPDPTTSPRRGYQFGLDHDLTVGNTNFMTWNLMHPVTTRNNAGGLPTYGKRHAERGASTDYDFADTEYRYGKPAECLARPQAVRRPASTTVVERGGSSWGCAPKAEPTPTMLRTGA